MPLLDTAILAALQGLAEALPLSSSGHEAAARVWLDVDSSALGLGPIQKLAIALALAVAARERLGAALGDGIRAVARPTLFAVSPGAHDAAVLAIGCSVSLVVSQLLSPRVELWRDAPLPTGIGLLVTGAMLASTFVSRRAQGQMASVPPTLTASALTGAAHGLAVFPGASRVGAALTVLLWMGAHPSRAVDLALLLTIPTLLFGFAQSTSAAAGASGGLIAMSVVLAFVAAIAASGVLSSLARRHRVGSLALWIIPLGLAMLAYARAVRPPGA